MPDGNPLVDDTNLRLVQRLAEGDRQVEIAAALHLTRHAVRGRLHRLRRMAEVETNAELVAVALRRGWIS